MNYRIAKLLASTLYEADKTEIIDIDLKDPISMIQIFYCPYNTAPSGGSGSTAHPAGCLTKIDVVDGSDYLFSLNGHEVQALDFYHNKKMPYGKVVYQDDQYSHQVFQINFGRFLYDELLALDPNQFRNLQLKVAIDLDGGGVLPDKGRMEVLAHVFDQKSISPQGFFMAKQLKNYTLVANGHEYTDLPTDYPIRKLFLKALRSAYTVDLQLAHIKLSEEGDKRVIVDENTREYLAILMSQTPPCEEMLTIAGQSTITTFHCMPAQNVVVVGSGNKSTVVEAVTFGAVAGGSFTEIQDDSGFNIQAIARGHAPHGVLEFPFGKQDDPADWFDVRTLGNLKADITAGSSPGSGQTCQIIAQQLRNY